MLFPPLHAAAVPPHQLPPAAKIFLFGDSILHFNDLSTTATREFSKQFRGEFEWAHALDPRFRLETFRDITRNYGPFKGDTGTLGNNPFNSDGANPSTITVTLVAHGMVAGGGYLGGAEFVFSGATGAFSMNGGWRVATVPNSSTFTVAAGAQVTAGAFGGSAVAYKQRMDAANTVFMGKASNWGISGDHTDGTLDLLQPGNGFPSSGSFTLANVSDAVAVLACGTNDINSSNTVAAIQGRLLQIVARLLALGFGAVVVVKIRPRGTPETFALPPNPILTTASSTTLAVSHPNHPYLAGQTAAFSGMAPVDGLTLTGPYPILTTGMSADSYTITGPGIPTTGGVQGGGSSASVVNASALLYPIGDARWTTTDTLNKWLDTNPFGNPKVSILPVDRYLDPNLVVVPATGIKGAAKSRFLLDGAHPSPLGAYDFGRYTLLPALQSIFASGPPWFGSDPTTAGNNFPNGGQTGTGGTNGAGSAGSLPDFWTMVRTTGHTVLASTAVKSNISTGIDKVTFTLTTGAPGANLFETFTYRTGADIAWINSGTAKVISVQLLTAGPNPTCRLVHNGLNNGAPLLGGALTLANVLEGTLNGVNLAGTWTCSNIVAYGSNVTFDFVATGQTASATIAATNRTVDWTYDNTPVIPANAYLRCGAFVEVGAWDKWRGIQFFGQSRNGSTGVMTWRAGRPFDQNRRLMPQEAWSGWLVSEPFKMDSEATASVNNLRLGWQFDAECSAAGQQTATIAFSRPFLRVVTDPATVWT